jgi:hypothetical protein
MMRIELLCDVDWHDREQQCYGGAVLVLRPYGTAEVLALGELVGTVRGAQLHGSLHGINHPHARGDGVFLPDIHGVLRTAAGIPILCTFRGRTVFDDPRGDAMMWVTFAAEDAAYRWLNNAVCMYEGVVNPRPHGRIYVCSNELVAGAAPEDSAA